MNEMIDRFSQHYKIERAECEQFLSNFSEYDCAKKDNIVMPGGFNDDSDVSLWFAYPGDVVFNVWCYCRNNSSPIGIEAMTQISALVISRERLTVMCSESCLYANVFRKILEAHAADYEENTISLLGCDGGLERYLSILKRHPELLQHIPLNKLASYLQLAPQSLSRIRARIK